MASKAPRKSPPKPAKVWVSRSVGKYRVGGKVSPFWAFVLAGGLLGRLVGLAWLGLAIYGLWLAATK
jgi:hypothetical protein